MIRPAIGAIIPIANAGSVNINFVRTSTLLISLNALLISGNDGAIIAFANMVSILANNMVISNKFFLFMSISFRNNVD